VEISTAITALADQLPRHPSKPGFRWLERARSATATLVPALADAIAKAVEAIRGLR